MVLAGILLIAFIVLINALPLAFVGMLFAGSLGFHWSFGTSLLGALTVKFVSHSVFQPTNKK